MFIRAASLATTVKDLMVARKTPQDTHEILAALNMHFPGGFITKRADSGNRTLLPDTFSMDLEIRTQLTIAALWCCTEWEDGGLNQVVERIFYEPAQRNPGLPNNQVFVRNTCLGDIMRAQSYAQDQTKEIHKRVRLIQSTVRENSNAAEVAIVVDFEQLDELFPWVKFLTSLAQWGRSHLVEITQSIKEGGIEDIPRPLSKWDKAPTAVPSIQYL
jgi:hypothetical protein